jgi:hypothetical protein
VIGRSAFCFFMTLTLLTPLTACNPFVDGEPRIDRSSGLLADRRFQWTTGPGVDLLIGPAVPIRAYTEARSDVDITGNIDYAYPGFEQAVAADSVDGDQRIFVRNLRPDARRPVDKAPVGNSRYLIQSLTRSGQTVTATLCNYRYGMALENENGTFSSVAHILVNDTGIDTFLLRLTAPSDESSNALPPQAGPAPAPDVDVFGDWKITGLLNRFAENDPDFDKVWPTYEADQATCVEKAPDPPERRAFLINGEHPRSDFPTSPPDPRWPEGGSE